MTKNEQYQHHQAPPQLSRLLIIQRRLLQCHYFTRETRKVLNSHFIDAVSSLESSLLDLLDLVPAHVEGLQVGEAVEEAEGGDLADLVVGEDEVGGGGRDPGRDVQQVGVRTVNLAPIAPENISTSTKIFRSLENISYLQSAGQRGSSTQPWVTTAPVASLSPCKYFRKLKNIINIYCEMSQCDV